MSSLYAAARPGVPVTCNGPCGRSWPQDPPFEVACPECKAPAGTYCRRPSEHSGPLVPFHAARDRAALEAGFYGGPCESDATGACSPPAPDDKGGVTPDLFSQPPA